MDIKAIRKKLGMSQSTFARMLQCSEHTVVGWESGAHSPSPVFIREIHRVITEIEESRKKEQKND